MQSGKSGERLNAGALVILASHLGRPGRGAMGSFPAATRQQFQTWR
jgi:3-phosphoglycerate kinase